MRLCRSVFVISGFLWALSIPCQAPYEAQSFPKPVMPSQQGLSAKRLADMEKEMWRLVNQDRLNPTTLAETEGQAQPLIWNDQLAAVARAHSRKMIEEEYFSHIDPDGKSPLARINASGIPWRAYGENIAIHETVEGAQAAFMSEPRFKKNHRSNILNTMYTEVGIGIAQAPNGSLYITQDFIKVPASSED